MIITSSLCSAGRQSTPQLTSVQALTPPTLVAGLQKEHTEQRSIWELFQHIDGNPVSLLRLL